MVHFGSFYKIPLFILFFFAAYRAASILALACKYSVLPHITDKHMRFSPPPANTSGGYTLI